MPVSPLSSAILSHMRAISSVPPPLPRSLPGLKASKCIDYGQLDALCHVSAQPSSWSALSILSAHDTFIRQYPKIFLQKKPRLPKLSKQEATRQPSEETEGTQPQQPDDDSHDIAVHVKRARGGHSLYGSKKNEEKLEKFLAILKKLMFESLEQAPRVEVNGSLWQVTDNHTVLTAAGGDVAVTRNVPSHRTQHEHSTVWKMLKTVPELASQLTDDHLKTLSKNVIAETWVKGSTVVGNDGFCVILKGLARPRAQAYKDLTEEGGSTASFSPRRLRSLVSSEGLERAGPAETRVPGGDLTLRPWSTFGTLEVAAQAQSEVKEHSVVAEEDCEILKIPAKNYAKLKLEKTKLENKQIVQLIRKCPYYEEWPTLSIYELVLRVKWKRFPPGHGRMPVLLDDLRSPFQLEYSDSYEYTNQVIVESGNIISFVGYINSGHCDIYRNIVGLVKLQSKKVRKVRRPVYMGRLRQQESFGEISVLLQEPFPCTVVAADEVEMAVIEDKDLFELDPVTQQLMLQTAKPTFGHLADENVRNEYLQKQQQKEWKDFKDKTMKDSLYYNGIIPGFGKWNHHWTSIPRNLKDTLVSY